MDSETMAQEPDQKRRGGTLGASWTRTETLQRKRFAEDLIVKGKCDRDVAEALVEEFGLAETTAAGYVREAWIALRPGPEERRGQRDRIRARLIKMLEKYEHSEPAAAVQCVDRLCKLDGLYEPERVEITHGLAESAAAHIGRFDADARAALRTVIGQAKALGDIVDVADGADDPRLH